MSNCFPSFAGARVALWTGLGLAALGAAPLALAAPGAGAALQIQIADSTVLAPSEPAPIAIASVPKATPVDLSPAPVPNLDVSGPLGAAPEARLSPALLSRNTEFEGDGFSHASNNDYVRDQREAPAAGVNLSVPVK